MKQLDSSDLKSELSYNCKQITFFARKTFPRYLVKIEISQGELVLVTEVMIILLDVETAQKLMLVMLLADNFMIMANRIARLYRAISGL